MCVFIYVFMHMYILAYASWSSSTHQINRPCTVSPYLDWLIKVAIREIITLVAKKKTASVPSLSNPSPAACTSLVFFSVDHNKTNPSTSHQAMSKGNWDSLALKLTVQHLPPRPPTRIFPLIHHSINFLRRETEAPLPLLLSTFLSAIVPFILVLSHISCH